LDWTAGASRGCLHVADLTDLEPQARFIWSCRGRKHLQVLASPWHSSPPANPLFSASFHQREPPHLLVRKDVHETPIFTQPCPPNKGSTIVTCLALLKQEALEPKNTDSIQSLTFDMEQERVEQTPQEKKPNMSSLTRRACYKCGNVGHYAEMCSSTERLCYNCKQPGHESNGCPHPRTTES
jgi:hypothetical protein